MRYGLFGSLSIVIAMSLLTIHRKSELETWTNALFEQTSERSEQSHPFQQHQTCCPIVELRQYTTYPGQRDTLMDLFDREFVESQEAVSMTIIGQFRDLDKPDRFVWLRGFRDMPSRGQALKGFYYGPVWQAHRGEANPTMIDATNVLLLRPVSRLSGFSLNIKDRPKLAASEVSKGLVIATVYYFHTPVSADFIDFFEHTIKPVVTRSGASILAYFVTESSANNFPALPIRENEHVLVWFMGFPDQAAYERHTLALSRSRRWRSEIAGELARRLKGTPEVLRLQPTARSLLHG